ncbi:MAG: hypothetical protein UR94_C0012G0017 [Parcubacteria group bacterium GW2011_GWA2_36_10]|nr:MAG: hypothetical protein UR94_C0012G0017 [Parcubacteria group bacterium GW2011_GWA2_36_10]
MSLSNQNGGNMKQHKRQRGQGASWVKFRRRITNAKDVIVKSKRRKHEKARRTTWTRCELGQVPSPDVCSSQQAKSPADGDERTSRSTPAIENKLPSPGNRPSQKTAHRGDQTSPCANKTSWHLSSHTSLARLAVVAHAQSK